MLFALNRRFSSAGRAPALQAGGQRFDPVNLHLNDDSLAQLVEHLTFNQRVTGSSPVRVIWNKRAGLAQLVEHLICNQRVEGSNPLAGTIRGSSSVVEHHLAKVGVAGSNPVFRFLSSSRGGGTGRRTGLKILRRVFSVPVRFRSSAFLNKYIFFSAHSSIG